MHHLPFNFSLNTSWLRKAFRQEARSRRPGLLALGSVRKSLRAPRRGEPAGPEGRARSDGAGWPCGTQRRLRLQPGVRPRGGCAASSTGGSRSALTGLLSPCCVQYHRYIEIAIKQCRSSGIDCKIHGLVLLGRVRAEDEDWAAVPFLASDNEEEEDEKASGGRWASVPWRPCSPAHAGSALSQDTFRYGRSRRERVLAPMGLSGES